MWPRSSAHTPHVGTDGNIGGVLVSPAFQARYGNLSDAVLGLLAAGNQLGSIIGCIVAGWIADTYGRRLAILGAASLLVVSCLVISLPAVLPGGSLSPIFAGRILSGVAGGIASTAVPLHVSECAMAAWRGGTEACFQLAIEVGILAAYTLSTPACRPPTLRPMAAPRLGRCSRVRGATWGRLRDRAHAVRLGRLARGAAAAGRRLSLLRPPAAARVAPLACVAGAAGAGGGAAVEPAHAQARRAS